MKDAESKRITKNFTFRNSDLCPGLIFFKIALAISQLAVHAHYMHCRTWVLAVYLVLLAQTIIAA